MHLHPLNQVRNPPKFYRLFRVVVSPVGAFYSIKFGQFGGKIEVVEQKILIAIYAYIKVFDNLTLRTNLRHLALSETIQNFTDSLGQLLVRFMPFTA